MRVSKRLLPMLLDRCASTFRSCAADARLVGDALPCARVRTEEVNYLLYNLLHLSSYPPPLPSSSTPPSPSSATTPATSSPRAHLLSLYGCLLPLASLSIPTAQTNDGRPSWFAANGDGMVSIGSSIVLSAPPALPHGLPSDLFRLGRVGKSSAVQASRPDLLAHDCLVVIGKMLGLPVV